jgi:putative ABC transport system permease protein
LTRAPGVNAAAVAFALPLEGGVFQRISVDGRESPEFIRNFAVGNAVTPDYFRVFGIPLLRGRNFIPQEIESISESTGKAPGKSAPIVAIVNQTMARRYWPNQDPVGRVFNIEGADEATIIGVVGDTRASASEPLFPQTYYPLPWGLRSQNGTMSIVVKGAADSGALASTVRHQVRVLDDSLALYRVRTMREVISDSMSWAISQSRLLTTFALLALVLTAVGIYGVMAYAVTQRTHEVGLRLALGAQSGEILRLVMSQGARITVAGITLGVIAALALTRVLVNQLFGVEPRDPVTFVAVAVILVAIALLATYVPARRAAKVDPMVALRHE